MSIFADKFLGQAPSKLSPGDAARLLTQQQGTGGNPKMLDSIGEALGNLYGVGGGSGLQPASPEMASSMGQLIGNHFGGGTGQQSASPQQAQGLAQQVFAEEIPMQLAPKPSAAMQAPQAAPFAQAAAPKQAQELLGRYGPGIAQLVQALRG